MQALFSRLKGTPGITLLCVVAMSYFTYMHHNAYPPNLFWDENYHIASAQKYLSGVFFMEPHPPLGKLLIAAGEKIFDVNDNDAIFTGTDYGREIPSGFSFVGYRFFPSLLGWLTAPLLYGIFFFITRRHLAAGLLSFLYVFDNAQIVHARSAMLDSTLVFFVVAAILSFFLVWEWNDRPRRFLAASALFGASFAGVMLTKLNGLIVILLAPALLYLLWPNRQKIWTFLGAGLLAFLIVYIGVWQIHFSLGKTIIPGLPDNGYYQASEQQKQILATGKQGSLAAFPVMLKDAWKFVGHYSGGVPRLDLCKEDENGSPFFFWPFGARSINYRWETPDGEHYRYLYLQVNPVIWLVSLAGLFLGAALFILPFLVPLQRKLKKPFTLGLFLVLYVCYMIAIAPLDRVMYLYHYFIPLIFTFCITAIVFEEIEQIGKWILTAHRKTLLLLGLSTCIFLSFLFYRPLTYYEPLSNEAFERRAIFPLWELECVNCQSESMLVIPTK